MRTDVLDNESLARLALRPREQVQANSNVGFLARLGLTEEVGLDGYTTRLSSRRAGVLVVVPSRSFAMLISTTGTSERAMAEAYNEVMSSAGSDQVLFAILPVYAS